MHLSNKIVMQEVSVEATTEDTEPQQISDDRMDPDSDKDSDCSSMPVC